MSTTPYSEFGRRHAQLTARSTHMTPTYKVVKLDKRSIAGDDFWTVIEYSDGVCKGGDHHWVRARYARRALLVYQTHPGLHGHCTPTDLGYRYQQLTGQPMYDTDKQWKESQQ